MAIVRKNRTFQGPPADTYQDLVAALPPRPLHDRVDYGHAVEMIGRLVGYDLNADQQDYLDALAVFVQRYESEHDQTQVRTSVTGIDVLRSLVIEHDMTGADLSRLLKASRQLGPMILRGERALTVAHARRLGEHFKVDPGVFVR